MKEPFLSSLSTSNHIATSGIARYSLSDPLSDFYQDDLNSQLVYLELFSWGICR